MAGFLTLAELRVYMSAGYVALCPVGAPTSCFCPWFLATVASLA